ncbi:MAG: hypothetical protein JWO07_563 [Candidatus Saccharibacteria bacterium]|nr:hypothetical protein [Candidatus Saccharibacteria bacterium]
MIQILLHSSKTMRVPEVPTAPLGGPKLIDQATKLAAEFRKLAPVQLAKIMQISSVKAAGVQKMYAGWSDDAALQTPAIDAFIGDIYSGLQVQTWSDGDRDYAQRHLLILSGLYGALRACDGIMPYRLEMGYKLPDGGSLYDFWGDAIAGVLPADTTQVINLSSVEYTRAVLPYTDVPVVTPKFLTVSPKTGEAIFVTVHAKIARGAFARWLIQNKIENVAELKNFAELNYSYDASASTPEQPVFVCQDFGGIGLSVRLI